ncbi:hypothetical protein GH714_010740 [Hevea brasiliensis]|uniref:Uncharacterized protein n=1 Tax=Hevea brasiliensis TaxID=3981 RepID=A0A6A6MM18_HEVBR|nr:hypothetical protein GH714_010740 [Hevea brasiliensis]
MVPLPPLKLNPRNDEEFAAVKPQQEKSSKFLVYLLAGIVILSAIFLVFALVVMRPRTPHLELSLVSVKNLVYTNNNASFPSFNMTLEAEFSIENQNFGMFKFENSTANVLYGGTTVGKAIIGKGLVRARGKEKIKVKVDVRSYRLSDTEKLSKDINSGILKLNSLAKFSGKVKFWQIRVAMAETTEQAKPLAPSAFQSLSDEEEALSTQLKLHQRKCIKCCGCFIAFLLILAVTVLVLFFTVFHIKDPVVRMNTLTLDLEPLLLPNGSFSSRTDTNVTLLADISVKNPNFASFKFNNGTTTVLYGGTVVGEARTHQRRPRQGGRFT